MDALKEWAALLNWLKRPFFAFVAVVTLCVLLLYGDAVEWLGLGSYRPIVAAVFLVALVVLLSQILAFAAEKIAKWNRRRKALIRCYDRLRNLTREEKVILRGYYVEETRTQYLDINDGVVAGLVSAGIIYRATTMSSHFTKFAYNITDTAWDFIQLYPDVLA